MDFSSLSNMKIRCQQYRSESHKFYKSGTDNAMEIERWKRSFLGRVGFTENLVILLNKCMIKMWQIYQLVNIKDIFKIWMAAACLVFI